MSTQNSYRLRALDHQPIVYHASHPYSAYIDACRHHIERFRVDLQDPLLKEKMIEANLPREHLPEKNNSHGVLLIHGLLDSPMQLQCMEREFAAKGYHVRSLLLPGHGTVPGELLTIDYQDWIHTVNEAILAFKEKVSSLTLVGFSTGAAISLYLVQQGLSVEGLILFAPAIKIKNPLAYATHWHRLISRWIPRAAWFHIGQDSDYAKYQSIAFNGIYQVYRLTQALQTSYQPITVPIFMILTDSDEAISSSAAENYFYQQQHPDNRLLIYSDQRTIASHSQVTIKSTQNEAAQILDYSHMCLSISSQHPHYGIGGDYQEWSHYDSWWGRLFKKEGTTYYGALTPKNLKAHRLCRLTYNPQFDDLMQDLLAFVDEHRQTRHAEPIQHQPA